MLDTQPTASTARERYDRLLPKRQPFLDRARECAKLTIPALMPESGHSSSSRLPQPFQSIGARGVNNLASKLLLTLVAPTRKFFRLVVDGALKREMNPKDLSEFEIALVEVEKHINQKIEALAVRPSVFEAMRQLIVSGNVLIHVHSKGSKVFTLDQYVVSRSPMGEVLEIVVKEVIDASEVPESIRTSSEYTLREAKNAESETEDLYTRIHKLPNGSWKVYQEIQGITVPGSEGTYGRKKRLPWLALRWTRIDGEDYGRGHCEEYIGDLKSVESLSRSIIRTAAVAAKTVFLVRRGATTNLSELNKAEEGEFVHGDADDIKALELGKYGDMQIAKVTLDEVTTRLSFAFLLNSAVRRQGERVTAEEIRYMAGELEDALGGVYSIQSQEFQLPLVEIVKELLERSKELPALPQADVKVTIVTGIDALGRSHELASLDAFVGGALEAFGPNVMSYINMTEYLKRRAAGLDLETKGLLKTPEEIAAEQQAQQQQSIAEKAVGPAIGAAAKAMTPAQGNTAA